MVEFFASAAGYIRDKNVAGDGYFAQAVRRANLVCRNLGATGEEISR